MTVCLVSYGFSLAGVIFTPSGRIHDMSCGPYGDLMDRACLAKGVMLSTLAQSVLWKTCAVPERGDNVRKMRKEVRLTVRERINECCRLAQKKMRTVAPWGEIFARCPFVPCAKWPESRTFLLSFVKNISSGHSFF